MNPNTPFSFEVDYRASSQEVTFLQYGWGVRDVRGPYIRSNVGTLLIDDRHIKNIQRIDISFRLSASNRLPTDAATVIVEGPGSTQVIIIRKNEDHTVSLPSVSKCAGQILIKITPPQANFGSRIMLNDVISLDWIRIETCNSLS